MKPLALAVILALGACGGCRSSQSMTAAENEIRAGNLTMQFELSDYEPVAGQQLVATVLVRNTGLTTQRIVSPTSAAVYIRIYRRGEFGDELVAQYPQLVAQVVTPWTLSAGQERTFQIPLQVGPDWPTNQRLRVAAELSGRPDARMDQTIVVKPGS